MLTPSAQQFLCSCICRATLLNVTAVNVHLVLIDPYLAMVTNLWLREFDQGWRFLNVTRWPRVCSSFTPAPVASPFRCSSPYHFVQTPSSHCPTFNVRTAIQSLCSRGKTYHGGSLSAVILGVVIGICEVALAFISRFLKATYTYPCTKKCINPAPASPGRCQHIGVKLERRRSQE